MSLPEVGKGDLYIPVTRNATAGHVPMEHKPETRQSPPIPRSTKALYTVTSSAGRDRRKDRLASNARPTTKILPGTVSSSIVGPTPLATPPRSTNSSRPSDFIQDPIFYPEAYVTHHYTHCTHTSPPANRPLNVQPTLIYSGPDSPTSTLLGRCYNCDSAFRREQETSVLQKYHQRSNSLHLRLLAVRETLQDDTAEAEEDAIKQIVNEIDDLVANRNTDVKQVWKGFSARWGPGTVGVTRGMGRMNVQWERPEKERAR